MLTTTNGTHQLCTLYGKVASILGMDLAIPVRAILAIGGVFHLVLPQVWMMMMMTMVA